MLTSLFMNTLLCLSFVRLIIELKKLRLELGLLYKQININKIFPKSSLSCSQIA